MTARYADHDEVFEAGDAFYAPPSHVPVQNEPGTEFLWFSPSELCTAEATGGPSPGSGSRLPPSFDRSTPSTKGSPTATRSSRPTSSWWPTSPLRLSARGQGVEVPSGCPFRTAGLEVGRPSLAKPLRPDWSGLHDHHPVALG